jgi:triosephosphate isomerase
MRRPIIAANWKMNHTTSETQAFAERLMALVDDAVPVDVVIAPPTGLLAPLAAALDGRPDLALACQHVHWESSGAFTGETAVGLAADLGCRYVIIGHSERRALFGETDEQVGLKVRAVLGAGLTAIVCVGETLEEREADATTDVVGRQLDGALSGLEADAVPSLVIAYEPVWAIGTGRTATPEMAQEVHAFIRQRLAERLGETTAEVRIQYGGSVKPGNAADLMAEPDIDGALVGGASLDAQDFAKIVHAGGGSAR